MKVEVISFYWGKFKVPEIVKRQWRKQTTGFKYTLKEIKEPVYRNISLLEYIRKSDADVVALVDADIVVPLNAIEVIKKEVTDPLVLYYMPRVLLSLDTTTKLLNNEMEVTDINPVGVRDETNKKFRGIADKDRTVDNYPGTPGAYGFCQIGDRKLMENIIPKKPYKGCHIYDDIMKHSNINVPLSVDCYHLNHEVLYENQD